MDKNERARVVAGAGGLRVPTEGAAQYTTALADRLDFGVPNELRLLKAWLLWKRGQAQPGGKFDKIPYYASGGIRRGAQGSPEDLAGLVTFDEALITLRQGGYDGLGMAMIGQGIVGLDFDGCRGEDGNIAPWVSDLCRGTYMEISPSGTGIRAFYRGAFPDRKNHEARIEVFCRQGFLTVTGTRLNGCDLAKMSDAAADELTRRLGPDKARSNSAAVVSEACAKDPVLARLNERGLILRGKGGGKFDITCPFEASHTTPGGSGDAVYFAAHTGGFSSGNFDCKHAHCAERPQAEFRAALGLGAMASGGPPAEAYELYPEAHAMGSTARARASVGDEARPGNGARVILTRGDSLSVKPIRWTWDGYLARSKLHVLAGAIGTGKSTIAIYCAATVTTGGLWPDGTKCDPGDVLVWSDEDDPEDTLLPRFLAAGGDPKRIHFVMGTVDRDGKRHFDPATDIPELIVAARNTTDLGLVIVDPVVTVVAGDSHKNTEVRRALRPLVGLASDLVSAVLGISHHTKGTAGRDPVERITGSLAFGALPRVTMAAARDGSDPDRGIFCRTKSNIGPPTGGWSYKLVLSDVPGGAGVSVVRVRWGDAFEGSARDLLAGAEATGGPEERDNRDEERSALDDAMDWLRELLKDGPVNSKEIRSDANQAGIAWPTVVRAKTRLGVTATKAGYQGKWRWSLPEHSASEGGSEDSQDPTTHTNLDRLWNPTPLEPSWDAGSTKGDQAPEKNKGLDHLCSNLGVARVVGDRDAKGDQGFEFVVGKAAAPLIHRVVITIGEGAAKRSFETSSPAGLTLDEWQSRVLKAYGPGATVRGVAP